MKSSIVSAIVVGNDEEPTVVVLYNEKLHVSRIYTLSPKSFDEIHDLFEELLGGDVTEKI